MAETSFSSNNNNNLNDLQNFTTSSRGDLLEKARIFLQNPKIQQTPLAEQRNFLIEKGYTNQEIETLLQQIPYQANNEVNV